MNSQPAQNDVSTALGLLRDSLAEEEQRIRSKVIENVTGARGAAARWAARKSPSSRAPDKLI